MDFLNRRTLPEVTFLPGGVPSIEWSSRDEVNSEQKGSRRVIGRVWPILSVAALRCSTVTSQCMLRVPDANPLLLDNGCVGVKWRRQKKQKKGTHDRSELSLPSSRDFGRGRIPSFSRTCFKGSPSFQSKTGRTSFNSSL